MGRLGDPAADGHLPHTAASHKSHQLWWRGHGPRGGIQISRISKQETGWVFTLTTAWMSALQALIHVK